MTGRYRINLELSAKAKPQAGSAAGSAFIVMGAAAVSALLGFGREIISAHYYGTSRDMDAFINASTIPIVLFGVLNGALVAALVPTFSAYIGAGRTDEARKLGSTVFNLLFLVISALAILGWIFAPFYVPVLARGFPPAEQSLVVTMVRWLLPGILATSLGGVCSALLNANGRFLSSSLIWTVTNIVTISCMLLLHRAMGIFALVIGSMLGLFAQLAVQIPSVLRSKLYSFVLDLRHPGLAKVWSLIIPVAIGSSAGQVNIGFDRYFASTLDAGSTAALNYTTKLSLLPNLVIAGAIATVMFPLFSSQFATARIPEMRHSISLSLRMVGFIVVPCAVGLTVLGYPIVQALFERGAFGEESTRLCAMLVPFAALPLIALSYNSVLGRACYACEEARIAVVASMVGVALNIGLSATLLPFLAARGLLLANGISEILLVGFQVLLLNRLVKGLEWTAMLSSFARVSASAIVMGSIIFWLANHVYVTTDDTSFRAVRLGVLLLSGVAIYIGLCSALRVDEMKIAFTALTRRIGRVY